MSEVAKSTTLETRSGCCGYLLDGLLLLALLRWMWLYPHRTWGCVAWNAWWDSTSFLPNGQTLSIAGVVWSSLAAIFVHRLLLGLRLDSSIHHLIESGGRYIA